MTWTNLRTITLAYFFLFTLHPAQALRCNTVIPNVSLTDASGEQDTCSGVAGQVCYYQCQPGYEENPVFPSLLCNSDGTWNASVEHLCFRTAEIDQFCQLFGNSWVRYAVGGLLGLAAVASVPAILALFGFGPLGPVAGSLAAAWMAKLGVVAAGSLYSFLQALAMGGVSLMGKVSITSIISVLFGWLLGDRCSCINSNGQSCTHARACEKSIPNGQFHTACVATIGSACSYICNPGYTRTSDAAKCLSNLQWNIIETGHEFCIKNYWLKLY